MSGRPARMGGIAATIRRLRTARPSERREWLFALALLTPACLMLAVFVAYPFGRGIWLYEGTRPFLACQGESLLST